jgi:plastocyanin
VVFVEPIDANPMAADSETVVIHQRASRFEPEFVVVAVDQPVTFANRDKIFHGVFSYSRPNEFEERPFAPGQTRTVSFRHAGAVQIYSPIDGAMQGLIVVVPEGHHAIPNARGDFRISGLAAGRYRLSVWAEAHEGTAREISLATGEVKRAHIALRLAH